ncbi:MAG: type II secretion system F family protein [Acidimicrobiia bacterium]
MTGGGSWMLLVGALALFGALFVVLAMALGPRVRRRRLAAELAGPTQSSARAQLSSLGAKAAELAERALQRSDRERLLNTALDRAGIDMRAPEFAVLVLSTAVAAGFVGMILGGILLAVVAFAIAVASFAATVNVKATRRRKAFEEQLPDSLALIAGGLRAGHSLPQAVDALAQESEAPTCDEFRRVLFETQLGHSLPVALRSLAERIRSEDFEWVVQAIEIQQDVGGDLAAVLDNVTRTIRDRNRVSRQIDTLTAEGRLSAIILFCLPVGMFIFMKVSNPAYFDELTNTLAGNVMLIGGCALLVVGGFWLRRIIRLVY